MAVSIVMTGTGRNCTLTSGSNSIVVSSAAGLVVGATIQGTGITAGTRIRSISGTTVLMETATGADAPATATNATASLIFSSVWGSVLTVSMSASGDTANMDTIYNAGFGVKERGLAVREIYFPGAMGLIWRDMVAGSVFDYQNWTIEFGSGGYWAWSQSSILGELRGGYLVNGTQFIKAAGPTFISNNFKNSTAGGSNMFIDTATGTMTGTFRMNNMRVLYQVGSNTAPFFVTGRMNCAVDNAYLDYSAGSGANAGIGAAFGYMKNTTIVKANSGLGNPNLGNYATIDGLNYSGIYTDSPNHKFAIPNNYVLEGYAPQVLSTQTLGGFQDNTTETFANIDLSTAGWGLNDLKTKYLRYGGPNVINFPRRVALQFNDSTGADLTGVTLYINSGGTSLVNAVQAGDYSANTQALVLNWSTSVASYRVATSIVDTISQTAQFRKNGYVSQSVSYSLNNSAYSQPIFMLADPAYGSVTPAQAAALTGLSLDYTNKIYTVSTNHNLDEVYAFGQYSQALPANSAQTDFQTSAGGKYSLTSPWKMSVTAGALTMGGYNNTFNSSTAWTFGSSASLTMDKDDVVWTPAARADLFQFQSGSTFNITNGSTLTVSPTAGLGYGTATTSEFRSGSTLNMSDSTVTYNIVTGGSGTVFSNTEAGATWNISNSTLTLNNTGGAQVAIHAYFLPASVINGLTVNGTATNVVWQMGFTTNNSKMVGFKYGGSIFGNGTSNILMDTYTYTGSASTITNTFGSANKWWWVDPVMQAGGLFRWAAGSTPTGNSGFYGVIGFRPTIAVDKAGYAPSMRFKPSAMATRYPQMIVATTALSTVPLSNFFRDPTFMAASDGFLPFLDSLDSKTVLNTIDWTVDVRQPGWVDQTITFTAATAKKGLITTTFSGAVDSNYVNATTGAADAALITVNTVSKTIAPNSGTLAWSPQRLYNALKNWWSSYASDTDFLSSTGSGVLNLGDYNVSANLSFIAGISTDALSSVRTTGRIYAATNGIPVTDSLGTSTIWQFQSIQVGTSLAIWDSSGTTKYYQSQVTSAGTYQLYIPSGTTGTLTYGVAKYGKRFEYGTFPANAGGVLFYVPDYQDDVGITEATLATVEAYTAIDTSSKFYDRAGAFKLTEQGIKLGDIAVRSGTAIETGSYSILVTQNAASVFGVVGSLITIKSTSFAGDSKYLSIIATAPATVTADTNEVITIEIEDANGNSSVTLNGGDGTFELWKIPALTATNDYETGTLLDTASNEKFRFIGIAGFDMVGVDINSNIRRRISMAKGVYTMAFYVGDQIQLAQAPQVIENGIKLDVLQVDLDALITDVEAIKGAGFASTDSLVAINSNVKALPLLSEIEASTLLAKESSITALGSPLQADDYLAPDNAKIATIDTNVASIGVLVADLPLLSEIEASTVLAKESSITALGAPLQADDYLAPDNATIAEIQTKVDTLQNVDLSNVPADVWAYAVRTLTTAAGLTEAQVALLEGIKTKTDLLPAQPAGVGDAMTLTTAYDASKTAASQSSVNALGAPLQAGDYQAPDNAGIAVLVTDVGNVPLAVRQELATELARIDVEISTRSDLTVEDIPEGLTVAEIEASTVLAKEKSVQNTMAIAASRIAF